MDVKRDGAPKKVNLIYKGTFWRAFKSMAFVNYRLVNITYAETQISDSQMLLHDTKTED